MTIRRPTACRRLLKRAVAIPLSAVLAVSCTPAVALAGADSLGSSGLRAASAADVQASASGKLVAGKVLASASSASASPQALYLPVLLRAVGGTDEFEESYQACGDELWAPSYALFDLGNDGVPELLVRANAAGGSASVHVYTVKSHEVEYLGSYSEGAGSTAGTGDGRLLVAGWSQGQSFVNEVVVANGKARSKFVASGQASNTYFSKVGATWIEFGDAYKYVTLKAEGKYEIDKATVNVAAAGAYSGAAKTPAVAVKFGDETLVPGTDFSVAYKNNVNAGTAAVTITGKGSFRGSKTLSFAISKAANSLAAKASSKTLKRSQVKSKAQTFKPVSLSSKGQGKVQYKNVSAKSVAKCFSVNASSGAVTAKKGTGKGTYQVKVQVSAAGDGNHVAASKTVTSKVVVK